MLKVLVGWDELGMLTMLLRNDCLKIHFCSILLGFNYCGDTRICRSYLPNMHWHGVSGYLLKSRQVQ